MNKLKYIFVVIMIIGITFVACEKNLIVQQNEDSGKNGLNQEFTIEDFAIALAKVLAESKECREFVNSISKCNFVGRIG